MVYIYLLTHKKADVPPWSWAALRFKTPPLSGGGSVLDLDLMALDRQSEFVSVDKQSNDDVMHLNRFGKADRLACQALDART
jgi:hypothetical protein